MDRAWIGVVGVVVGVIASYPLQALQAKRADAYERAHRFRADRVAAYSRFAEKIMDWRRSQVIRSMLSIEPGSASEVAAEIKDENRRVRAAASTAFYQVKLICDDGNIEKLAETVAITTKSMKRARDRQSLNATGDMVRATLGDFLQAAARQTASNGKPR